jgi:hypothetical protein
LRNCEVEHYTADEKENALFSITVNRANIAVVSGRRLSPKRTLPSCESHKDEQTDRYFQARLRQNDRVCSPARLDLERRALFGASGFPRQEGFQDEKP